jgi:hypothetical protein
MALYRSWISNVAVSPWTTLSFSGLADKPITVSEVSLPVSNYLRPIDMVSEVASSGVMNVRGSSYDSTHEGLLVHSLVVGVAFWSCIFD